MRNLPFGLQKLMSYFTEITLYEGSTEHNPAVEVLLSRGRLKLNTPQATYSHEDKYYCYYNAFLQLGIHSIPLNKVLILGYGLGSVAVILERLFAKNAEYTAVEIDYDILSLARQYEPEELQGKVAYYAADAWEFVTNTHEDYDLIAVDLFLDNVIPEQFRTKEFLEHLKHCVAPNGLILFNWLSYTETFRQETENYFQSTFQSVYPHAEMLETGGNRMLWTKGVES